MKTAESTFAGHLVSAPGRSNGKSIFSMGLARAASRRSIHVQTFKKGPDYIDPLWLKRSSGNPCYNLDPYLQSDQEWQSLYQSYPGELVLVEGTMGVHDGLSLDGSDSNGAIAKRLGLPVLLVMDCRGMHRTIASLINGIQQFDSNIEYSGVVLNRIKSDRHARKIEKAIHEYCDMKVRGVLVDNTELHIDEKELGLIPAPERSNTNDYLESVADALEESCDIDSLLAPNCVRKAHCSVAPNIHQNAQPLLKVGIAKDEAFHFYYEDDLNELQSRGIELVEFSPLRESLPDALDGVIIGGGFPERHAAALSGNTACREALASAIADGLPVRAECGGLMYLCNSIEIDQVVWPMVGAINGSSHMQVKAQGRGYMQLQFTDRAPDSGQLSPLFNAHEFHHSNISFDTQPKFLYEVKRGFGIDGQHDGVSVQNIVASYAHFRHTAATPWVDWFLETINHSKRDTSKACIHV